tara:strand:+ start:76 stop:603 length:528 start_codon:yes stop_codon:yes gene_type:complete
MTITFHPDGRVTGAGAVNFGSSGNIIQTVIGANGESSSSSLNLTGSISSPTFLDSGCMVTITPKRSNSKILLTWSAGVRQNPSTMGYVGVFYSPNSNMSSPIVIDKSRSPNLNESFRNNDTNYHMWESWSRISWDETITNTNTRYYNVGGYAQAGNIYYGDHQVALQLMAQEIAV